VNPVEHEPAKLQFDFDKSVGYWVFATMHELSRAMNVELAALGITSRQWEVLAWTAIDPELSQCRLAERMSIEAPTLVGVLDRMERDGWIQRLPAEADRRRKLIRPTAKVEPLWTKMVECAHRVRAKATTGMTAEQLVSLRELLAHVRANLATDDVTE
jgi:DNA-binding MarR family transcriptional regulator